MSQTAAGMRCLEDFEGPIIASNELTAGSLANSTVALIGDPSTVASIAPSIATQTGHLKVFQREGAWVLPAAIDLVHWSLRRAVPPRTRSQIAVGLARMHLRRHVPNAWRRRQLTPLRRPRRRDLLYSDRYYRTLERPNVTLVTWPIATVVPAGIRTADGLEHHVDAIITASTPST